jgi:hypothetical protein
LYKHPELVPCLGMIVFLLNHHFNISLPANYNDLFHPDMGKGLLLDSAMTNTNNKDVNWLV